VDLKLAGFGSSKISGPQPALALLQRRRRPLRSRVPDRANETTDQRRGMHISVR